MLINTILFKKEAAILHHNLELIQYERFSPYKQPQNCTDASFKKKNAVSKYLTKMEGNENKPQLFCLNSHQYFIGVFSFKKFMD